MTCKMKKRKRQRGLSIGTLAIKVEKRRVTERSELTPRLYSRFNVYKVVKRVIANDEIFKASGGSIPLYSQVHLLRDVDYLPRKPRTKYTP